MTRDPKLYNRPYHNSNYAIWLSADIQGEHYLGMNRYRFDHNQS